MIYLDEIGKVKPEATNDEKISLILKYLSEIKNNIEVNFKNLEASVEALNKANSASQE